MSLSNFLTFMAALSVATERIVAFVKQLPYLSDWLSARKTGRPEEFRVLAVNALAAFAGTLLCHAFPAALKSAGLGDGTNAAWSVCGACGLLASGGSSF